MQEHPLHDAKAMPTGTFTLRGMDPELRAALDAEAKQRGLSMNGLVLEKLRASMGLAGPDHRFHDLDRLVGVWSQEDIDEFDAAVAPFEEIDPELWSDGENS
jgi:hypothetical protein